MKKTFYVKKLIITALCISLCVILPMAFHSIPNAGTIFSPMHIPVLICGLVCGWQWGLFCGIAGSFLSSVLTQMPPMAFLPSMMIELAVYGLVTGIMMKHIHTRKIYVDLYISLITGMLLGRIVAGVVNALIFQVGEYSIAIWVTTYFVTALPGIIMQLILVPTIILALERAKLIPKRG